MPSRDAPSTSLCKLASHWPYPWSWVLSTFLVLGDARCTSSSWWLWAVALDPWPATESPKTARLMARTPWICPACLRAVLRAMVSFMSLLWWWDSFPCSWHVIFLSTRPTTSCSPMFKAPFAPSKTSCTPSPFCLNWSCAGAKVLYHQLPCASWCCWEPSTCMSSSRMHMSPIFIIKGASCNGMNSVSCLVIWWQPWSCWTSSTWYWQMRVPCCFSLDVRKWNSMMRKQAPIWKLSQQSGSGLFINFSLSWRVPRNVIKWWCFVPAVLLWSWWVCNWACWMSMPVFQPLFSMVAFVGSNSTRIPRYRWRVRSVACEDVLRSYDSLSLRGDLLRVWCRHGTMSPLRAGKKTNLPISTCMKALFSYQLPYL